MFPGCLGDSFELENLDRDICFGSFVTDSRMVYIISLSEKIPMFDCLFLFYIHKYSPSCELACVARMGGGGF